MVVALVGVVVITVVPVCVGDINIGCDRVNVVGVGTFTAILRVSVNVSVRVTASSCSCKSSRYCDW